MAHEPLHKQPLCKPLCTLLSLHHPVIPVLVAGMFSYLTHCATTVQLYCHFLARPNLLLRGSLVPGLTFTT